MPFDGDCCGMDGCLCNCVVKLFWLILVLDAALFGGGCLVSFDERCSRCSRCSSSLILFDLARGSLVFLVDQWNLGIAAWSHYALLKDDVALLRARPVFSFY